MRRKSKAEFIQEVILHLFRQLKAVGLDDIEISMYSIGTYTFLKVLISG